jgi:hypothetical protein
MPRGYGFSRAKRRQRRLIDRQYTLSREVLLPRRPYDANLSSYIGGDGAVIDPCLLIIQRIYRSEANLEGREGKAGDPAEERLRSAAVDSRRFNASIFLLTLSYPLRMAKGKQMRQFRTLIIKR